MSAGGGVVFYFQVWRLSSWTVDSPLSMQALFICLFLRFGGGAGGVKAKSSQVPDMFPEEFPIAPHFNPKGNVVLL